MRAVAAVKVEGQGGIGLRIRDARRRAGMNLKQLGKAIGVTAPTLSKIENDLIPLTYAKLMAISEAVGVNVSEMLDARSSPSGTVTARRSINKRGGGETLFHPNFDYVYLNTDLDRKQMVPVLSTVRARTLEEFGAFTRHAGEEFMYVLSGTVEVRTEFYTAAVLEAGESIYLDSTMGHAYLSRGSSEAQILFICTHGIPTDSADLSHEPVDRPTGVTPLRPR